MAVVVQEIVVANALGHVVVHAVLVVLEVAQGEPFSQFITN